MTRLDKLLARLKEVRGPVNLLCRTPSGEERSMDLLEAMRTGSVFIRTLDGDHEFDELYKAVLSIKEIDFSDLPEVV